MWAAVYWTITLSLIFKHTCGVADGWWIGMYVKHAYYSPQHHKCCHYKFNIQNYSV